MLLTAGVLGAGCGEDPVETVRSALLTNFSATAFQGSNHDMWRDPAGTNSCMDTTFTMSPGSVPSQFRLSDGTSEYGWQDGNGHFEFIHLGVDPNPTVSAAILQGGTSPSIVTFGSILAFGFHGSAGHLWLSTSGLAGGYDSGQGMQSGTSPSVVQTANDLMAEGHNGANGHFIVNLNVHSTNAGNTFTDTNGAMWSGTSPSIAPLPPPTEGIAFAFHGTNGDLWAGANGTGKGGFDTGQAMQGGTSPSITVDGSGTPWVAFHPNASNFLTVCSVVGLTASCSQWGNPSFPMASGASPVISTTPSGKFQVVFKLSNGDAGIAVQGSGVEDENATMN